VISVLIAQVGLGYYLGSRREVAKVTHETASEHSLEILLRQG
jgi:hypothetical protein